MWAPQVLVFLVVAGITTAQIPSLGWCPDYQAMANFDMNRFLGQWHEAERYFTVTELGSRCVTTNYEKMPDGRVWVSNEIRNAFTGVKRVLDGQLTVVGRDGEGKISIKYTSLPVPYDAQYSVLDTDYTTYAVIWSCSGIGPVHTQNAWVMTRNRLAPGPVLQRAYGVLDRYKISRAFFVKTNQDDCTIQPAPIEAVDPTPASVTTPAADNPVQARSPDEEAKKDEPKEKSVGPVITVPELILQNAENEAKLQEAPAVGEAPAVPSSDSVLEQAPPAEEPSADAPASPIKQEFRKSETENKNKKVEKKSEHKNVKPIAEVSKAEP